MINRKIQSITHERNDLHDNDGERPADRQIGPQ